VGATFESAAEVFGERSTMAGLRQAVVAANPELRERELIKLAALAAALADALRERGVADPAASLAAEAGVAVFKIAFGRWAGGTDEESLKQVIQDSMAELKTVAAGSRRAVTR
jgi:hypothetical protein